MPFSELTGQTLVVEEKIDGANSAISFSEQGDLLLQSRGHYLTGGYRERHFNLMKSWANCHQKRFHQVLGDRYILYGEWVYATHTIFYDQLPHYFLEFDLFDKAQGRFFSTEKRRRLLKDLPIASVPVLKSGRFAALKDLTRLIGPSLYKSPAWAEAMAVAAEREGVSPQWLREKTDGSDLMEGLYIKHESEEAVLGRYKYVRADFLTAVFNADGHWLDRPIVPNRLAPDVDLFALS